MRPYLYSEKYNDRSIRLTIGGPFQRELRLNFVESEGKIIVIPTGEWVDELKIYPFAKVGSTYLRAYFENIGNYANLFTDKYGKEHFDRYFKGVESIVVFQPTDGEPEYNLDILGKIFDRVVDDYIVEIQSNWVQRYMREQTTRLLNEYATDGCSIIDLGCGPNSEVFSLGKRVRLTEVDASEVSLRRSKEMHPKAEADVKWILAEGNENFSETYDIVFSSYGFLNLEDPKKIVNILNYNLKNGGYFIGSFLNKYGLLDLFLNFVQGRGGYVRERISGKLTANYSRYNSLSFPREPGFFDTLDGMERVSRAGVCSIIPPYNYKKLISMASKLDFIKRIDSAVGHLPILWSCSDYIIFAYRKTGAVNFRS